MEHLVVPKYTPPVFNHCDIITATAIQQFVCYVCSSFMFDEEVKDKVRKNYLKLFKFSIVIILSVFNIK